MLPCLNFDIQVEIMKRLPVKSLIRFRSVCKAWKSLIDSSRFVAGHNVSHDQSEHLMVCYEVEYGEESKIKYVSFVDDDSDSFPQNKFSPPVPPILLSLDEYEIIGSSCGLVCLEGSLQEPDGSSKTHMVVLWNPSIRKSIAVVVPNEVQSRCYPFVNFGVCPKTKDPKLVKFSSGQEVMVFTLSSGKWRCLSSNLLPFKPLLFDIEENLQTVIGRFLYRLTDGGEASRMLSFDLSTDEFREVPLPDSLVQSHLGISKLRESLVLIDHNGRDSTTGIYVCDVWMMMEDGALTKLFTIKDIQWIWGFKKTGEPVVEILEDENSTSLVVYEPCLEHMKDLGIGEKGHLFNGSFNTESLLLLDHDDGRVITSSCEELNHGIHRD
ncbi:hypothetical protein OSB04_un000069 [Centaurea solstitialis]|uniref:F-box domain-containing protein n=1 Tax=Centaurea solstitialis TaxID=347529 RepID=A0AA38W2Z0_9ASTR|nr:hypothetical protein OSB04_un000069 [Centaurea solstitialis]